MIYCSTKVLLFQKNVVLKVLNLSWNGFGKEGAAGLGRALEENRTLLSLDVSNNRFGTDAVGYLIKGIQNNDGLKTLKVCYFYKNYFVN